MAAEKSSGPDKISLEEVEVLLVEDVENWALESLKKDVPALAFAGLDSLLIQEYEVSLKAEVGPAAQSMFTETLLMSADGEEQVVDMLGRLRNILIEGILAKSNVKMEDFSEAFIHLEHSQAKKMHTRALEKDPGLTPAGFAIEYREYLLKQLEEA